MVLGCDMYDFTTEALLKRGKVLTEHLIKRLADYGYQGVYIDDDISSGVEVKELVRVETRVHAIEAIRAMDVDAAKDVAEDIVEQILDADDVSVDMVDLRSYDDYTYFHSVSVAILAVIVGSALDYSKSRLWELCLSGMFHDIGKMFIDPNILNKPALLTSEEFGCMRETFRNRAEGEVLLWSKGNFSGGCRREERRSGRGSACHDRPDAVNCIP